MARFRERLKAAVKSFTQPNWVNTNLPGNTFSSWGRGTGAQLIGTNVNWNSITGDIFQNPVCLACFTFLWRNMAQATLVVESPSPDGEVEKTNDHDVLTLLNTPNANMDWATLLCAILHDLLTDGNAYLGIDRQGVIPVSLTYLPYASVRVVKQGETWGVRMASGAEVIVPYEDLIAFRFGVDPNDFTKGFSPYKSVQRQQYTIDSAANYSANIMRNFGVIGGLATPNDGESTFDPQQFVEYWQDMRTGDGVGKMMAYDVPINLQFPDTSPQKMTLDTFADRPEADICAVFGVAPQVIGVHTGRHSKTYANVKEAREYAWEETIIPLLNLITSALTKSLLPQMGGQEGERIGVDLSRIRPLQPDLDALHKRAREDWQAKLIDRATWKRIVGMTPMPDDEGVYYVGNAAPNADAPGGNTDATQGQ